MHDSENQVIRRRGRLYPNSQRDFARPTLKRNGARDTRIRTVTTEQLADAELGIATGIPVRGMGDPHCNGGACERGLRAPRSCSRARWQSNRQSMVDSRVAETRLVGQSPKREKQVSAKTSFTETWLTEARKNQAWLTTTIKND